MCREVAGPGDVVMQTPHFSMFDIHAPVYATNHIHGHVDRNRIFLREYHRGVIRLSPVGEIGLCRSNSLIIPKETSRRLLTSEAAVFHP